MNALTTRDLGPAAPARLGQAPRLSLAVHENLAAGLSATKALVTDLIAIAGRSPLNSAGLMETALDGVEWLAAIEGDLRRALEAEHPDARDPYLHPAAGRGGSV